MDNSLSDDVIKELEEGVTLQDGIKCLPATIVKLPENIDSNGNQFYNYEITIREGMYHQVHFSFFFFFFLKQIFLKTNKIWILLMSI